MSLRVVAILFLLLIAGTLGLLTWRTLREGWSVELTTIGRKSGLRRSVTIWFVRDGDRVWLQAGQGGKTDWYRNLLASPRVELDFGGNERRRGEAFPVDDAAEVARIHARFVDKYWMTRVFRLFGREFGGGRVVRVELFSPDE
ncbi:MAG: nitroreductase family deazaflavin-dependent oxidoreductase [bacterium]|nr:nitroreductase family deazaflavin-dependent oxidoreductase [bacterium]